MNAVERRAPEAVDTKIDYLVPTSRINRRFWAPGAELNTGIYDSYAVTVRNARLAPEPFTLDRNGFCLATHRSRIADFRDADAVNRLYPDEVALVARALTGCDLVVPLGPQIRSSGRTGPTVQPPAAEAHVDFNTKTARRMAQAIYDKAAPGGPRFHRFIAFSLWRTFSPPPQDWPLALCDYASVGDEEGVPNVKVDVDEIPTGDALFAPIEGEEEMAAATVFRHNPGHRWWYFPDMVPEEVIFIKVHDSDHSRAWRAPHTAFRDTSRPDAHVRESLEFRAVAYFSRAG